MKCNVMGHTWVTEDGNHKKYYCLAVLNRNVLAGTKCTKAES